MRIRLEPTADGRPYPCALRLCRRLCAGAGLLLRARPLADVDLPATLGPLRRRDGDLQHPIAEVGFGLIGVNAIGERLRHLRI